MSTATSRSTAVGVFHTRREAQAAVRELKAAGFTDKQIGVLGADTDGEAARELQSDESGSKAAEGAAIGAGVGLGTGALWGLGIAAGVLPAIGPVIAGGTLAAILASAAGTAAAGGIAGGLIGAGIPEEEATYYQEQVESGRTVVSVHTSDEAHYQRATSILDGANAYDYDRRESDYARDEKAAQRPDLNGKMVARKEVATVDKHSRAAEDVTLRREVHTETKQVEVPLKKEELVVERTPINRETNSAISGKTTEERVTLREEVASVNKKTVAKEAVSIGKKTVENDVKIQTELKEEEIKVERSKRSDR